MVLWSILISGEPPFGDSGADNEAIMKKVGLGKYDIEHGAWKNVSKEAKDLIKKLLTYDPAERISAEQALKHPWIADHSSL